MAEEHWTVLIGGPGDGHPYQLVPGCEEFVFPVEPLPQTESELFAEVLSKMPPRFGRATYHLKEGLMYYQGTTY